MNNIASVCTYVFCYNDDRELCTLVGKRISSSPTGANLYTPPMGMVEQGENPYDATVRECFEETGIKIPKHKVVSYDTETYQMQGKQYTGVNFYAFLDGTISNYPIGEGDGENEKFIWLPLSKKNTIPWAFGTGNKINEILNKLNMTKKNIIRLTENQLKKVISESVKQIISELDYKTYANAAHKALRRGDFARGDRFKQAAIDAFNRDYRYTNGHEEYSMNDLDDWGNDGIINIYADLEPESPQEEDILANPHRYKTGLQFRTYSGDDSEGVVHYFDKLDGRKYQKDRDGIPRSYSDDLKQATIKGNKDLTNFAKGKYEYTKGKGWHLKDKK